MKLFKLMEWLFPAYFQMHVAAAVVGAGVAGAAISAGGAQSAADTQAGAANNATQTNLNMYNQTRADQAPWRAAGNNALSAISGGFGLGPASGGVASGQFNHTFDANDLKNGLAPNYDFQLQQGLGSVNNQASMTGGLVGGNALKGINDYAQNYAGNAYQQAFNNYNTNQTNIYNRLANIAGLGQTANGQTAQAGTTLAGNIGSGQLAAGASQAAGTIGATNAISGAVNNAAGWYAGNQFLNGGSSSAIVPSAGSYSTNDFLTS
jgi:hypothetical protein